MVTKKKCSCKTMKGKQCKNRPVYDFTTKKYSDRCGTHLKIFYAQYQPQTYNDITGESEILPPEMWEMIIEPLDLKSLANLHLTSKYFYENIVKIIAKFENKPLYVILRDSNNRLIEGNYNWYRFLRYHMSDDFILPNGKLLNERPFSYEYISSVFPLLNEINNYSSFIKMVKKMYVTSDSQEDFRLIKEKEEIMEKKMLDYINNTYACELFNSIINLPQVFLPEGKLVRSGSLALDFRNNMDLIKILTKKLKMVYPQTQLFRNRDNLYIGLNGLHDYAKDIDVE